MADKEIPEIEKKVTSNKTSEQVTAEDMHELLSFLHVALESRDKVVDHLQTQIALNQQQIEQNKKILAKRGIVYRLIFGLLALAVLVVGFDQHTIIKSFDKDMSNVSKDMDKMLAEMTAMRKAIESMATDMHSMSGDFSKVSTGVTSIDTSVESISHGVRGMSYDTHEMNRSMDTMTPPWSPW